MVKGYLVLTTRLAVAPPGASSDVEGGPFRAPRRYNHNLSLRRYRTTEAAWRCWLTRLGRSVASLLTLLALALGLTLPALDPGVVERMPNHEHLILNADPADWARLLAEHQHADQLPADQPVLRERAGLPTSTAGAGQPRVIAVRSMNADGSPFFDVLSQSVLLPVSPAPAVVAMGRPIVGQASDDPLAPAQTVPTPPPRVIQPSETVSI